MSKRQAAPKPEELIQKLDDKVAVIKEEIEGIVEELKNDVTAKGNEIEENKIRRDLKREVVLQY